MGEINNTQVVVLSIGDVSFDWLWFHISNNEIEGEERQYAWETQNHMEAVAVHGGAWFAESILKLINKQSMDSNTGVYDTQLIYGYQRLPVNYLRAGNSNQFVHSVTHFDLFKYKKILSEYKNYSNIPDKVYRIKISPMYFGPVRNDGNAIFPRLEQCKINLYEERKKKFEDAYKNLILKGSKNKQSNNQGEDYSDIFKLSRPYPNHPFQIIQILDEGNGFSENKDSWKRILSNDNTVLKIIILNLKVLMTFERFINTKHDQESNSYWECINVLPTIVVISANELRKHGVKISRGLSWERTAQDLLDQLKNHKILNKLLENRHLIVRFGISGAIHCNGNLDHRPSNLYYDPEGLEGLEGEYRIPQLHGHMNGFNSIMGGTLVRNLVEIINKSHISKSGSEIEINKFIDDSIAKSIPQGLDNCRHFFCKGIGPSANKLSKTLENIDAFQVSNQKTNNVESPIEVVANVNGSSIFCKHIINDKPDWKIIDSVKELEDTAMNIVQHGCDEIFINSNDSANDKFPFVRFGNLVTVDRKEIESYRSIRNLFREYRGKDAETPLSIAVFGPPGSGKSFGIKEIAKSISNNKPLEYNLSQFTTSKDLSRALLKVRDVGINGEIPIVFFDEFDSKFENTNMGWLKYFLSVMQDGEFKHEETVLNIGKAILIFAGGTKNTLEDFSLESIPDDKGTFKLAKGPDFESRLRGFVNIIGPDRVDDKDDVFVIRRAIIIRSLLERYYSHLIDNRIGLPINHNVLRAFLQTSKYKHGVRSIQAILEMSTLTGASSFDKSHLPSDEQLAMHVDPKEFLKYVSTE